MDVTDLLAALTVFIAAPLNWVVAAMLIRLSLRAQHVRVLRERAVTAVALAFIVTVFALIFVNNSFVPPFLDFETTKYITRGTLLVLSVLPTIYWLRLYLRVAPTTRSIEEKENQEP